MTGLLMDGQTIACWILDPVTGAEFVARKGLGASHNGQEIKKPESIEEVVRASDMRGAILSRFLAPKLRSRVDQGRKLLGRATSGMLCAGAEYPAIALGQQDFALFWRTLPWDHAPGTLLVTEAGGHVARPDGDVYRPSDGKSGLLAARSYSCWTEVHKALLA
jgi:fructose-1,6-bisphosphatase/inositol monophosphatase family enzyme